MHEELFEACKKVWQERGKQYGNTFDEMQAEELLAIVKLKVLRLKNMLRGGLQTKNPPVDRIKDNIVDIVNYLVVLFQRVSNWQMIVQYEVKWPDMVSKPTDFYWVDDKTSGDE